MIYFSIVDVLSVVVLYVRVIWSALTARSCRAACFQPNAPMATCTGRYPDRLRLLTF